MIPAFEAAAAHEPASVAEAARVMEQLAREGRRVGFVGGGTELELGAGCAASSSTSRPTW